MAGVGIRVTVEGGAGDELRDLMGRIDDLGSFFAAASETMLDQTQRRFREQRAPDGSPWAPLAASTIARRGSASPILERSGTLRGGIHAAPTPSAAIVRSLDLPYAAIHQAGGKAGRGRSVEIPARPYLGFGSKDVAELIEVAEAVILAGG